MIHTTLFWFTVLAPFVVFALTYVRRRQIAVNAQYLANERLSSRELAQLRRQESARSTWITDIMRVVVSLALLASGLYVILPGTYDSGSQKWASGAVGAVVGFRLRGRPNT